MAGASVSDSSSHGTSSSTSTPVQTPQSEWGLMLSQLLATLGDKTYNWAQEQFNSGMGITNQNIGKFMELSGRGAGLAQSLISEYQDVFDPLIKQYVSDAGTFASEGRQRFMAGQAESTVAQAGQQARDEAERKLQGFGINPNSGRYQDLLLTSRVQDAAARAGAGTKAAMDTADRGRAMTEKAIGFGQNLPGMAVNALQSAYTGVTGAENAILGILNTGANLTNTAAPLMNAASGAIKMPSQGTQAKSENASVGSTRSQSSDPSGSGKGGDKQQGGRGPGQQGDGSGGANSRGPSDRVGAPPVRMSNPYGQGQPNGGIKNVPGGDGTGSDVESPYIQDNGNIQPYFSPDLARDAQGQLKMPGDDFDSAPQAPNWLPSRSPSFDPATPGDFNTGGQPIKFDPWSQTPQPQNPDNPWGDEHTGSTPQYDPFKDDSQWSPNTFGDQRSFQDNTFDPNGGQDFSPQQPEQQWQEPQQNFEDNRDDTFEQDFQEPEQDFDANNDFTYGDDAEYQGGGYEEDWGDEYARGGPVRARGAAPRPRGRGVLPTSGGNVSRNLSPSKGRQVDDIPARLNAGEFVVPRDVVAHKGSQFFQSLIARSRKMRTGMTGAPARAKMRPALPNMQRPQFVSRPMGGR